MRRLDQLLVERKLAASRTKAQELIREHLVLVKHPDGSEECLALKASHEFADDTEIQILSSDLNRYVARSALKLKEALVSWQISQVAGRVLDVGQSTGGFTQVMLEWGAHKVFGIDVGHGQLAESLRMDPRVHCFERVNAKQLRSNPIWRELSDQHFQYIVIDVSFISATLVIPELLALTAPKASVFWLLKPQYEMGRDYQRLKGLDSAELLSQCIDRVKFVWLDMGWQLVAAHILNFKGAEGAQEFMLWLKN